MSVQRFLSLFRRSRRPFRRISDAFTILEIVIALFVVTFGLLGLLAMFPVGLKGSKETHVKTNASMLAESVYDYLLIAPEVRAPSNPPTADDLGRHLRFPILNPAATQDRRGLCSMFSTTELECVREDGSALNWSNSIWEDYVLLITSGALRGKLYRIRDNSNSNRLQFDPLVTFDFNDNGTGDFIPENARFVITGIANDETGPTPDNLDTIIPGSTFSGSTVQTRGLFTPTSGNPVPMPGIALPTATGSNAIRGNMKLFAMDEDQTPSGRTIFPFLYEDPGTLTEFTWAAILSDPQTSEPYGQTCRVDILIYREYDTTLRPDDPNQRPAVEVFTTFINAWRTYHVRDGMAGQQ